MSRRILLIEDNAQNRYLATFLLEQQGYHVSAEADGTAGVAAAATLQPDLILLDIQLPRMDGYAVARALREIDQLRQTPIIAVTSYAMVGDREKCIAAGCNGYIEKPINPETYLGEIEPIAGFEPTTPPPP